MSSFLFLFYSHLLDSNELYTFVIGEGQSSPIEKIGGWFRKAMSWTNNYSAWNYVVGKRKKKQDRPKTVITIDADEGEYSHHNKKDVRSYQARKVDREVIIIDDPPLLQSATRHNVSMHALTFNINNNSNYSIITTQSYT